MSPISAGDRIVVTRGSPCRGMRGTVLSAYQAKDRSRLFGDIWCYAVEMDEPVKGDRGFYKTIEWEDYEIRALDAVERLAELA